MKINSNMQALQASGILQGNESAFSKSTARLSSGYKINTSRDDPVGLAISNRMGTTSSSLKKANNNSVSGVSVVQTADGALSEMKEIIHRLKELSVKSANGTNTDADRQAMQAELDQLTEELDHIVEQTEYNGQKLLNGNLGVKGNTYVYPSESSDKVNYFGVNSISADLSEATDTSVTEYKFTTDDTGLSINGQKFLWGDIKDQSNTNSLGDSEIKSGDYTVKFNGVTFHLNVNEGSSIQDIRNSLNNHTIDASDPNATVTSFPDLTERKVNEDPAEPSDLHSGSAIGIGSIVQRDEDGNIVIVSSESPSTEDKGAQSLDTGISIESYNNRAMEGNGRTITVQDDENGIPRVVRYSGFEGENPKFTTDPLGKTFTYTDKAGNELVLSYRDNMVKGQPIYLDVISKGDMVIQVGSESGQEINITIPDLSLSSMGIGTIDVRTTDAAKESMAKLDNALEYVSRVASKIGATQNRFEANISNLNVTDENLTASYSTLRDTDMAAEMVEYTKLQILTQAGVSILSQANELPQQALQLLQ